MGSVYTTPPHPPTIYIQRGCEGFTTTSLCWGIIRSSDARFLRFLNPIFLRRTNPEKDVAVMGKRPFIGKLSELLIPGGSPRTPVDLKAQSPRGLRGYDLGGVGLGILAALERSGEAAGRRCVCSPRPGLAPAGKGKGCAGTGGGGGGFEEAEADCSENYTYVTCHGQGKSYTKVYYDGGLDCDGVAAGEYGVLGEPPSRITSEEGDVPVFQALDFLSSCQLCGKKLHDRDIYMYRGEKAFCSTECRSRQIMMDERKEQKCRNEASKAADVSSSPYTKGRIFSTGIVAI